MRWGGGLRLGQGGGAEGGMSRCRCVGGCCFWPREMFLKSTLNCSKQGRRASVRSIISISNYQQLPHATNF